MVFIRFFGVIFLFFIFCIVPHKRLYSRCMLSPLFKKYDRCQPKRKEKKKDGAAPMGRCHMRWREGRCRAPSEEMGWWPWRQPLRHRTPCSYTPYITSTHKHTCLNMPTIFTIINLVTYAQVLQ